MIKQSLDPQLSWLEHPAHNRAVAGSSPAGSTSARAWRNWQTHQTQDLAEKSMGVQVPSRAPRKNQELFGVHFFFGGRPPFFKLKKVCFNKYLFFTINNQLKIFHKHCNANKILKNVRVVNVNIKCHENFIVKMSQLNNLKLIEIKLQKYDFLLYNL